MQFFRSIAAETLELLKVIGHGGSIGKKNREHARSPSNAILSRTTNPPIEVKTTSIVDLKTKVPGESESDSIPANRADTEGDRERPVLPILIEEVFQLWDVCDAKKRRTDESDTPSSARRLVTFCAIRS